MYESRTDYLNRLLTMFKAPEKVTFWTKLKDKMLIILKSIRLTIVSFVLSMVACTIIVLVAFMISSLDNNIVKHFQYLLSNKEGVDTIRFFIALPCLSFSVYLGVSILISDL